MVSLMNGTPVVFLPATVSTHPVTTTANPRMAAKIVVFIAAMQSHSPGASSPLVGFFSSHSHSHAHSRLSGRRESEYEWECECELRERGLDNPSIKCHFLSVEKFDQLRALLRSYGSCLVAYSGGVDSVFLARVAHDVLGQKSLAAIADSPSLPRRELDEALALAERFHFPVRIVHTKEFDNAAYLANPDNRCFFCKHELFTELEPLARAEHFAVIAYGENASDVGDHRPGA